MEHFFRLVVMKHNGRIGEVSDLFATHLDDPQKTLFLGGAGVAEMLVWL